MELSTYVWPTEQLVSKPPKAFLTASLTVDDTFPSVICALSLLQLSSSVKAVPVSLIWSTSVILKRVSKALTHATCSWRSL
jgi:hypothetical protein